MDIDELTNEFIKAYDEWCNDEEHGMGGPAWEAMLEARDGLQRAQEQYIKDMQ